MKLHAFAGAATVVASLLLTPSSAQGALLFSDDFDTDAAATVLNFEAFNHWTVVNHPAQTVDYLRSGAFGIACAGGTGGCVDLDGSSGSAARMVSNAVFSFDTGVMYTLTLEVSGNQRGGTPDFVMFGLDGLLSVSTGPFQPSAAFLTQSVSFTFGNPLSARLFVADATGGGDFFGPILDNVRLFDNRALPEPGALGVLCLALAGLAAGLPRRR